MNVTNETCVQRVKVVLLQPAGPAANRGKRLGLFSRRLRPAAAPAPTPERFHALLHTLHNTHNEWNVYTAGRQLVLETTTLEYNRLTAILDHQGFSRADYEVSVEYERKWGML